MDNDDTNHSGTRSSNYKAPALLSRPRSTPFSLGMHMIYVECLNVSGLYTRSPSVCTRLFVMIFLFAAWLIYGTRIPSVPGTPFERTFVCRLVKISVLISFRLLFFAPYLSPHVTFLIGALHSSWGSLMLSFSSSSTPPPSSHTEGG